MPNEVVRSNEGKLTTLECLVCGHREVFSEQQFKTTDGYSCEVCDSPVRPSITRKGEVVRNRRTKQDKLESLELGRFTVDIDCSEALKGLKAVTREAKKATAALKEFEEAQEQCDIGNPLLQIVLDDIRSVPKVLYKGKEIRRKIRITFDWKTDDDRNKYTPRIHIEHGNLDDKGFPFINVIEHNPVIESQSDGD